MEEEIKRRFDAFSSVRDHAWREFEDKSKAEWRLSFGIWAALLALGGTLLTKNSKYINMYVLSISLALIVLLHGWFLYWIQCKLDNARIILHETQMAMRKILGLTTHSYKRKIFKQPALYVEIIITLIIAVLLVIVAANG